MLFTCLNKCTLYHITQNIALSARSRARSITYKKTKRECQATLSSGGKQWTRTIDLYSETHNVGHTQSYYY